MHSEVWSTSLDDGLPVALATVSDRRPKAVASHQKSHNCTRMCVVGCIVGLLLVLNDSTCSLYSTMVKDMTIIVL